MRLLALLFACYFSFLSCLTCTDEAAVGSGQRQATVAAARPRGGTGALGDWCTPFCQCQCCAGATLSPPLLRVNFRPAPVPAYVARRYATRPRLAVPARAPATPWQPPQAA